MRLEGKLVRQRSTDRMSGLGLADTKSFVQRVAVNASSHDLGIRNREFCDVMVLLNKRRGVLGTGVEAENGEWT